jgi:glutaredoxin
MSDPANGARVRVYWQPGCTSCLRTREFLTRHGVAYESIDVSVVPGARDELRALGARGLPVVALGKRYTLCQSFGDVLTFLDLRVGLDPPLPPADLVARADRVLASAVRHTRQFSAAQLATVFRNRNRTIGATCYHLFRVGEMFLDAAAGGELHVEGFAELPPPEWSGEDLARFGIDVRTLFAEWWQAESERKLTYKVHTYYGERACHDVLERTTYHMAQHGRQIMLMLESNGIAPADPLTPADLVGLPVPAEVWG